MNHAAFSKGAKHADAKTKIHISFFPATIHFFLQNMKLFPTQNSCSTLVWMLYLLQICMAQSPLDAGDVLEPTTAQIPTAQNTKPPSRSWWKYLTTTTSGGGSWTRRPQRTVRQNSMETQRNSRLEDADLDDEEGRGDEEVGNDEREVTLSVHPRGAVPGRLPEITLETQDSLGSHGESLTSDKRTTLLDYVPSLSGVTTWLYGSPQGGVSNARGAEEKSDPEVETFLELNRNPLNRDSYRSATSRWSETSHRSSATTRQIPSSATTRQTPIHLELSTSSPSLSQSLFWEEYLKWDQSRIDRHDLLGLSMQVSQQAVYEWLRFGIYLLFKERRWPDLMNLLIPDDSKFVPFSVPYLGTFSIRGFHISHLGPPREYDVRLEEEGIRVTLVGVPIEVKLELKQGDIGHHITVLSSQTNFASRFVPIFKTSEDGKSHLSLYARNPDLEFAAGLKQTVIAGNQFFRVVNHIITQYRPKIQHLAQKALVKAIEELLPTITGPAVYKAISSIFQATDDVLARNFKLHMNLHDNFELQDPSIRLGKGIVNLATNLVLDQNSLPEPGLTAAEFDMWFQKRPPKHWNHGHDPKTVVKLLDDPESGPCQESRYARMGFWKRLWRPWTWFRKFPKCTEPFYTKEASLPRKNSIPEDGKLKVAMMMFHVVVQLVVDEPGLVTEIRSTEKSKLLRCLNDACQWTQKRYQRLEDRAKENMKRLETEAKENMRRMEEKALRKREKALVAAAEKAARNDAEELAGAKSGWFDRFKRKPKVDIAPIDDQEELMQESPEQEEVDNTLMDRDEIREQAEPTEDLPVNDSLLRPKLVKRSEVPISLDLQRLVFEPNFAAVDDLNVRVYYNEKTTTIQ